MMMKCYINDILMDGQVKGEVKALIPDAGMRRRMGKVLKSAVSTAVECAGGVEALEHFQGIITATGLGCLADSERFLRNMVEEDERLLNPTPFIQSTFNTPGGQIALLGHNHGYNVTYVDRSHGFETALLDAMMRLQDGEGERFLVGYYEENTPTQTAVMTRMGLYPQGIPPCACVFASVGGKPSGSGSVEVAGMHFCKEALDRQECLEKYAASGDAALLYNDTGGQGASFSAPAMAFAKAVELIRKGVPEVVLYNSIWSERPVITVLRCISC